MPQHDQDTAPAILQTLGQVSDLLRELLHELPRDTLLVLSDPEGNQFGVALDFSIALFDDTSGNGRGECSLPEDLPEDEEMDVTDLIKAVTKAHQANPTDGQVAVVLYPV